MTTPAVADLVAVNLLPCPFCGGEAKVYGPVGWYRQYGISHSCSVFYGGSGDFTLGAKTEEQAIADWNRRALSPAATEPVAWMQRHKLGPHHLCNPDTQGNDDWSDPFPVYTHSSPVTAEAAAEVERLTKRLDQEIERGGEKSERICKEQRRANKAEAEVERLRAAMNDIYENVEYWNTLRISSKIRAALQRKEGDE